MKLVMLLLILVAGCAGTKARVAADWARTDGHEHRTARETNLY